MSLEPVSTRQMPAHELAGHHHITFALRDAYAHDRPWKRVRSIRLELSPKEISPGVNEMVNTYVIVFEDGTQQLHYEDDVLDVGWFS